MTTSTQFPDTSPSPTDQFAEDNAGTASTSFPDDHSSAETVPGMVVYVTHEPRAMTADVPVGILPKANDKYHHVGRRRSGKMGKWEACICHCSRTHNLGWYSSTHEAAYAYNVASKLLNHAAVPNVIASDNLPSPLRQQEIQVEVTFRLRCKKLIEESPGHKDHPQAAYRLYRVSAVSGYRGVSLNRQSNTWAAHVLHNERRVALGRYISQHEAAFAHNCGIGLLCPGGILNVIPPEHLAGPARRLEIQVEVTFRLRRLKLIEAPPGHKESLQTWYRPGAVSAISVIEG